MTLESSQRPRRDWRLTSFGGLALLAGCGSGQPAGPAPGGTPIACQLEEGDPFEPRCTIERGTGAEGVILTVRHPDGAFRRLLLVNDQRVMIAADGAEPAHVLAVRPDGLDVALGGAVYRLPRNAKP